MPKKLMILTKDELYCALELLGTASKVAEFLGLHQDTVYYWLKKYGIYRPNLGPNLSLSRARNFPLSRESEEILDGLVASDGSYVTNSAGRTAYFTLGTPFLAYAEVVASTLSSQDIECGLFNINHSEGPRHVARTPTAFPLAIHYKRWYPKGVKIVPRDIRNTGLMWKWLYIGDGSISDEGVIHFATNSFGRSDNDYLVEILSQHGIEAGRYRTNGYYYIRINRRNALDFIKFIGPCPVPFFKYKWKAKPPSNKNCSECNVPFETFDSRRVVCSDRCAYLRLKEYHILYRQYKKIH